MRAVGIEARLEPDPGVAILGFRVAAGDLAFHRVAARHRDFQFARALADGVANGVAADVGDFGARADERDFLVRLDHASGHRRGRHVDEFGPAQHVERGVAERQCQVVGLDSDAAGVADEFRDRAPEVVALPVRVDDVFTNRAAPGLAPVDVGRDRRACLGRHDAAVGTSERAVKKPRVIRHVLHRRQ